VFKCYRKSECKNGNFHWGFLFDMPGLLDDRLPVDHLFKYTSELDIEKPSLTFVNKLLQNTDLQKKFPSFVLTERANGLLDIVCYALQSGVPLLI